MTNPGTTEAEQSLNNPSTEEELAEHILTAVSEGNSDEMERLFSVELKPDAASDEEEDSEEEPSDNADDDEQDSSNEDGGAEDEEESDKPSPTKQEPSPAELRLAKLEKELNDAKASVGKMAFMQSRLAQLEAQLKASQSKKKEDEEAEADSKLQERIAKLREVDPDTADLIELLAKDRKPQKEPTPRQEHTYDPRISEEYAKVVAVHADADSIFKHPAWHLWKDTLTPEQRSWAESSQSAQVIEALRAFKAYREGLSAPEVPAAVQEEVVDATQVARSKKLQRSADGGDKPIKKAPKFDEAKFFEESYAQIAKEAGIVY